ncbi:MAG: hypothetical protein GYB64_16245 [Chloroflexi bacterium]|nr:hypothetical protein [Chloroflexota bacterium]
MTDEMLKQGIRAVRAGNRREARRILARVVQDAPDNATAWWYLALAVDEAERKAACLDRVLKLRPDHEEAQRMKAALQRRLARPTPAQGVERPMLEAAPDDDGTLSTRELPAPDLPASPPQPPRSETDDARDVTVAAIAVGVALLAIVGSIILVVSGSGEILGLTDPSVEPTAIPIGFDIPACSVTDNANSTIVFVNNTSVTLDVLTGPQGNTSYLMTLAPGEQESTEALPGLSTRYAVETADTRFGGTGASIEVPGGNLCIVPIGEGSR